ncbi:MAG: hypothetical protein PHC52_12940 [Syntrophales bacterium]|nr:hypothetical protein [Syntrophales bacterium]
MPVDKKPPKKKPKRPAHRPSKYDPDRHPIWAEGLAKLGKTQDDISAEFGISRSTMQAWKKRHPELSIALKIGKSEADTAVENSLYKRAMGYEYEEVKTVNDGERVEKTVKQVAPDVTAQIFWLKNRKPDAWKDKRHEEITGKDGGPVFVRDMTDEEVEKRAREILDKRSSSGN